jgi:hypothetical protein
MLQLWCTVVGALLPVWLMIVVVVVVTVVVVGRKGGLGFHGYSSNINNAKAP